MSTLSSQWPIQREPKGKREFDRPSLFPVHPQLSFEKGGLDNVAEEMFNITSAADYREKYGVKYKIVQLPSGAVFKIRKVQVMDFLASVTIPLGLLTEEDLKGWENMKSEERTELLQKSMTPEKSMNLANHLLMASVVSPKLTESDDPAEGELSLSEIGMVDQAILASEIAKLSGLDKASQESQRPFRS